MILHCFLGDKRSSQPSNLMYLFLRDAILKKEGVTEHILTKTNMTLTGNMHGFFSAHVGMRVRLKRNVSLKQGLAQEAEGNIIDVVLPDASSPELQSAWAAQACFEEFIVEEVPLGVWVLMDDYIQNPNTELAAQKIMDAGGGCVDEETGQRILCQEDKDLVRRLLFVERHTSFPFKVEHKKITYKLTRTQLPLTHGRVRTCQASQGRTFKSGVTIDMTKMKRTEEESWWLNLYVMLSRATALKHLLLFKAPGTKEEWDALQPPSDLVAALKRLKELARQTLVRKPRAQASAS